MNQNIVNFIRKYRQGFQLVRLLFDVDVKILLAQAAHETGWGASVPSNNMFGMKDLPFLEGSKSYTTQEVVAKQSITTTANFQTFDNYTNSILAYIYLVSTSKRYSEAWKNRRNPGRYFEELQKAGYATDPEYGAKLVRVYNSIPNNWMTI
ncbi:MAG TPA: glucosaminidase domain-containing protein [Fervidobacterium sp.]|nr:glucosaminidase domain-containing protein [Fervidobacterium sp.]